MYCNSVAKIRNHFHTLSSAVAGAVRNFFFVKTDPKLIFEKLHNQPVFKTLPYFSPIHNGKLIIMFYNLSGTGRFSQEIQA